MICTVEESEIPLRGSRGHSEWGESRNSISRKFLTELSVSVVRMRKPRPWDEKKGETPGPASGLLAQHHPLRLPLPPHPPPCTSDPCGFGSLSPRPAARSAILPLPGTLKVLKVKVLPSALLLPNYDRQIENELSKCQRTTNQHAKRVPALRGV